MRTYLELVNDVLRRMRENTVSSLYENAQSSVVADLVNDAKETVEQAHDWTCLRQDITVNYGVGSGTGALGVPSNTTIIGAYNQTTPARMTRVSMEYIRNKQLIPDQPNGTPTYYSVDSTDSNGNLQAEVWPKADKSTNVQYNCYVREAELTAEAILHCSLLSPSSCKP